MRFLFMALAVLIYLFSSQPAEGGDRHRERRARAAFALVAVTTVHHAPAVRVVPPSPVPAQTSYYYPPQALYQPTYYQPAGFYSGGGYAFGAGGCAGGNCGSSGGGRVGFFGRRR